MNLNQIQSAVHAGFKVHWINERYTVGVDKHGEWYVVWDEGGRQENYVGLVHSVTGELIGKPEAFYVAGSR